MSEIDDIHQLIDTRIRQKTADSSIQKEDVADTLDALVNALAETVGVAEFKNGQATIPANSLVSALVIYFSGNATDFRTSIGSTVVVDSCGVTTVFNDPILDTQKLRLWTVLVRQQTVATITLNAAGHAPVPEGVTAYILYKRFA